ncbi:hypothetical protein Ptr902_06853 [Pyrenophora tritici-repentis]|nr:hypothetical protein Ptr902_06853 [Pyrenophora tritici-repentis]
MDGDVGYGRAKAHLGSSAKEELGSAGIKVEMRSPDTPAQLGVIRVRDVRFIDKLYKEKPSTPPVEPRIIETVHIPEEEYDGDTIVVAQPVRQRQEAITTSVLPPDHVSEKEYNSDTIAVYQKPVR